MVDEGTASALAEGKGLFRRPSLVDAAVGGKARSLARLASFGLPVPPAFVIVSSAAAPVVEQEGPAAPPALRTPRQLAVLDEARAALLRAPFSTAFRQGLPLALEALGPGDEATFSVRSSAALEDSAEAAAPGVFDSVLRVPRTRVGEAVREVLASALAPGAWTYALRAGAQARGPIAVLVHRFVPGEAHGAAVCEPSGAAEPPVQIDVQQGQLGEGARAAIEAGARRAAAQAGAVELEWTAAADVVTFLQLRPFHRGRTAGEEAGVAVPEPGWLWDAAHNPAPLTPAQVGLVEWVDARCTLGFRQRVVGGYLFYQSQAMAAPAQAMAAPVGTPRALFDRLQADVSGGLAALGSAPRLRDVLAVYTRGYQGLFGAVQAACAVARAALRDFLRTHAPAALDSWAVLVESGVSSAATRRRAAVTAIAAAPDTAARAAAIGAYLQAFGDESGRWDVAEPTLRERPDALLSLITGPAPSSVGESGAPSVVTALASSFSEAQRAAFQAHLHAACEASAVSEDDDALFARLQAAVRGVLLALGERLVNEGRLIDADDVFFLPFDVTRALDETGEAPADLQGLAASGHAAFSAAIAHPPVPALPPRSSGHAISGQRGAGGRAIGRVVLHPSAIPPGPSPLVIVAATLLPTELPLLNAAALVVETGTPLGHVAAQARERGIPAIVAARGARAALHPGQLVLVDGDRGLVIPLEEA